MDKWTCKNCKLDVAKNTQCKCGNRIDNWACMTCHMCNPTGNTMKRCGAGNNEAYWRWSAKGVQCKCGNRQDCWRCYNCDFCIPKGNQCKCGNQEKNWRCNKCDKDNRMGLVCKCGNKQWSTHPLSSQIILLLRWNFGLFWTNLSIFTSWVLKINFIYI